MDISIQSGGSLDLTTIIDNKIQSGGTGNNFFTMKSLQGGGSIRIAEDHLLKITGSVSGTTTFQSSYLYPYGGATSGYVEEGRVYIESPLGTADDAFSFTPYDSQPNVKLIKTDAGDKVQWIAKKDSTGVAPANITLTGINSVYGTYFYDGTSIVPAVADVYVMGDDGEYVPEDVYTVSATNNINAGTATVKASAIAGSGYTGEVTGRFTILPRKITITANGETLFYGQTGVVPSWKITSGSLVNNDSLTGTLEIDYVNNKIIQGTLTSANNMNYNISFVEAPITVSETTPEIKIIPDYSLQIAGGAVQVQVSIKNPYDSTLKDLAEPALTWQIGNGVKNPLTGGTFTIPVGTPANSIITIEATSAAVTGKYKAASASVQVKVTNKTVVDDKLSISLHNIEYGNLPAFQVQLNGNSVGTGSWTYTYSNNNGASFSTLDALKNSSNLLPAGSYQVKAYYEDNSQAGEIVGTFEVTKKPLTIGMTATAVSKIYDGTTQVFGTKPVLSLRGAVAGENPVLKEDAVSFSYEDANAGKDKLIIAESIALTEADINANYSVLNRISAGGAEITAKPIIITPLSGQSKLYGQSDPGLQYTTNLSGGSESISFTGSLSRKAGEDAGTYEYTIGSLFAGNNYELSLDASTARFTINKASANISLSSDTLNQEAGKSVNLTVTVQNTSAATLVEGAGYPSAVLMSDKAGNTVSMENKGNGTFMGTYTIPSGKQAGEKIVLSVLTKDTNYNQASTEITLTVKEEQKIPSPGGEQDKEKQKIEINIGISHLPESLKTALGISTPKELEEIMRVKIAARESILTSNTMVYDIALMISKNDGQTWEKATVDNFPAAGLEVTLPYPAGTGKTTHNFFVAHMFTQDMNGKKAGELEYPAVTKTDEGIRFRVTGLSPVSVGWEKITQTVPTPQKPSVPGNSSSTGSGGGSSSTSSGSTTTAKVPKYNEQEFWKSVESVVLGAKPGDTVKVHAGGYNYMSRYVMDTLAKKGSVTMVINWNGGGTITIPAGKALNRAVEHYALAELEKTDFNKPLQAVNTQEVSLRVGSENRGGQTSHQQAPVSNNQKSAEENKTPQLTEEAAAGQEEVREDDEASLAEETVGEEPQVLPQESLREEPVEEAEKEQEKETDNSRILIIGIGLAVGLILIAIIAIIITIRRKRNENIGDVG